MTTDCSPSDSLLTRWLSHVGFFAVRGDREEARANEREKVTCDRPFLMNLSLSLLSLFSPFLHKHTHTYLFHDCTYHFRLKDIAWEYSGVEREEKGTAE